MATPILGRPRSFINMPVLPSVEDLKNPVDVQRFLGRVIRVYEENLRMIEQTQRASGTSFFFAKVLAPSSSYSYSCSVYQPGKILPNGTMNQTSIETANVYNSEESYKAEPGTLVAGDWMQCWLGPDDDGYIGIPLYGRGTIGLL